MKFTVFEGGKKYRVTLFELLLRQMRRRDNIKAELQTINKKLDVILKSLHKESNQNADNSAESSEYRRN